MDYEPLTQKIRGLIQPVLAGRQVEMVELTAHPTGGRMLVRCLVDKGSGITVEELSNLSRAIGAILDEHDAVPDRYVLEVNSPGLDRPLKRVPDFERVIGRRVRVLTRIPVESAQEHRGALLGAGEEAIVLRMDSGEKRQIPLAEITLAVQEVEL